MAEFGLNPGDEGGGGGGGEYDDQQQEHTIEDAAEPTLEIDLDEIENQNPESDQSPASSEKQLRTQSSSQILCK